MIDDTMGALSQENMQNIPQEAVLSEQPTTETAQQKNFRAIKEKAERAERERDDALRRIREIEAQRPSPNMADDDDDIRIGPDELAEGKHLSKVAQKIKKLEGKIQEYERKSSMETTEARVRSQFPDFDKVVTKENLEELRTQYPELAQTLNSSKDLYATASSAYTLINKLIKPDSNQYASERELVQKNSAKPRPLSSVSPQEGDSPLSRANAFAGGLTKELKEQLRKEMFEAMRNH